MDTRATPELVLESLSGPSQIRVPLRGPGPVTIGRSAQQAHTVHLDDPRVSRDHAVLRCRSWLGPQGSTSDQWTIADSGSRHGTWLNGVRVPTDRETPLRSGDLVVIAPWTFRITGGEAGEAPILATLTDVDFPAATIAQVAPVPEEALAKERLALLLRCASAIHAAPDGKALAEAVLQAAIQGTGFANAAFLRNHIEGEVVEVVASRGLISGEPSAPCVSRSVLRSAAAGQPVIVTGATDVPTESIAQLSIQEALCVPIMCESAVVGFLYLDNRGDSARSRRVTDDAAAFATGLARLAGLALANLQRAEIELRHARMEADLHAAGEIQRMLMPRHEGGAGRFRYVGESRPGLFVGGDFFEVIPLSGDRLAVAVGDVSGKGAPASVLISVAHGFLHAALEHHGDPGRAVTELNRFIHPRCPADRFLTLWLGVFSGDPLSLACVDAGHGHTLLRLPDGSFEPLNQKRECPVGLMPDMEYPTEVRDLPPGGLALAISDGLVEEHGSRPIDPKRIVEAQFGMERIRACLRDLPAGADPVAALFAAVERHAGGPALHDDATAVAVTW